MPRIRKATPEELQEVITTGMGKFRDALLKPSSSKVIERMQEELAKAFYFWAQLRTVIRTVPREQLKKLLTADPATIAEVCKRQSVPATELPIVEQFFERLSQKLAGQKASDDPAFSVRLMKLLIRIFEPKAFSPRRFKPEFEEGFHRQRHDPTLTATALAQELTPYDYRRNPASAIRGMQLGIARVKREHERCLEMGIPPPFLPPSHTNGRT